MGYKICAHSINNIFGAYKSYNFRVLIVFYSKRAIGYYFCYFPATQISYFMEILLAYNTVYDFKSTSLDLYN